MVTKPSEILQAWFIALFFFVTGGIDTLIGQEKFRIVQQPDSTTIQTATWTIDTVLTKGDPKCIHNWQTVPRGENQKYASAPDSLTRILNPRGERVVQEACTICGRERIKSENISFTKQRNPFKKR